MSREKALAEQYYADQEARLTGPPSRAREERTFTEDEAVAALFTAEGNVTKAAELLGVRSLTLRRFVDANPAARAEIDEALNRGVDLAVDVVFEGLRCEAWASRFAAAKEMLKSQASARRGFHQNSASLELKAPTGGAALVLRWLDHDTTAEPKTIEGEVIK